MIARLLLLSMLLACGSCGSRALTREFPESYSRASHWIVLDRQRYVAYEASTPIVIDGRLSESAWETAPNTARFQDIQGPLLPKPRFATTAKMLWDADYFYIAAELEEPHLWGTLTKRDSVIFHDNDFEVFIDPDGDTHNYYEFEINALGTEWDLLLEKPYRDGAPAVDAFDTPGLLTAVHLEGTLNDPSDIDSGWSVEIAIPWKALAQVAGRPVPPTDGDVWWVNFSRVQWQLVIKPNHDGTGQRYDKRARANGEALPEDNWVWSPQGVIAMHEPESWGLVMFANGTAERAFVDPPDLMQREFLRIVYHAQHAFREKHGEYSTFACTLGVDPSSACEGELELFVTPYGFDAALTWTDAESVKQVLRINERGHLW